MFKKLQGYVSRYQPAGLWIGIGRSTIAVAQASFLALTTTSALFQPLTGVAEGPKCQGIAQAGLFCLGEQIGLDSNTSKWIVIALLMIVASGVVPRWTAVPHAWLSLSVSWSINLPDGGEQVAVLATLFLIPILLPDLRLWHWSPLTYTPTPHWSGTGLAGIVLMRLQIAIIYLHSGLSKFGTEDWVNGSAEYYFVRDPMFGATGVVGDTMRWFTSYPAGTAFLTWSAIALEVAIGVLILGPFRQRVFSFTGALALHGFIIVTMGLWSFALIMIGTVFVAASPTMPRDMASIRKIFERPGLRKVSTEGVIPQ